MTQDINSAVFEYNPGLRVINTVIEQPRAIDLINQYNFKYADIQYAFDNSDKYVQQLLNDISNIISTLAISRKYVVVDVKIRKLLAGQLPANSYWHTDCTLNMLHPTQDDIHFFFISGADCRTQFITSPLKLQIDSNNMLRSINNTINNVMIDTVLIPENTLMCYTRQDLHRARPAMSAGVRFLLRVTLTDVVKPHNKCLKKY